LQNNTKICSLKYTSLYLVVQTNKSVSQGQGRQSLGQISNEFKYFACVPWQ